ncbi:MAG TPA: ABC transporter ATP-binding protein [Woeseiaceae bacterium]|nr:ABC transporter ATP-binding protein [Woeseiaceae bacterium]
MTETGNGAFLNARQLAVSVPGRHLVASLDVAFRRGEFVALLGRNGAGKTLTLLTFAGLRRAAAGDVHLKGLDIFTAPRAGVALDLALLPQSADDIFPTTVLDTALTGRHPHIRALQWETARDREIAMTALRAMKLEDLAMRDVLTLSGGERRRLAIAQIIAQAPTCYLLDEPTNHLDPQHQLDALRLFRRKADEGACVIASLHDVNLAARFADRCLLLYGDGRWELGTSDEILTNERLSELYGTAMESVQWRDQKIFVAAGNAPDNQESPR